MRKIRADLNRVRKPNYSPKSDKHHELTKPPLSQLRNLPEANVWDTPSSSHRKQNSDEMKVLPNATLEDDYESGSVGDEMQLSNDLVVVKESSQTSNSTVKDKIRGSVVRQTFHQSMLLKNMFDKDKQLMFDA